MIASNQPTCLRSADAAGALPAYASAARRFRSLSTLSLLAFLAAACGSDANTSQTQPPGEPEDFISGVPFSNSDGSPQTAGADDASAEGDGNNADVAKASDPARAISEADIIQRDGDTLYALSRYSGLSIIDIEDPQRLKMLGTYKSAGEPFEMYIENGVVLAMFNDYGHYVYDEDTQSSSWVSSSRIEAIDVSLATAPKQLGIVDVPGSIADSRRVGDVLYVVTNEYGCWRCSSGPSTVVSSLALEDLAKIDAVDELRFEQDPNSWQGSPSIAVTEERIYIGNRVYNGSWEGDEENGAPRAKGTIQAVDISDPAGDLTEGAEISIDGQIDNRWQMDEHEGVLRVLSQYENWSAEAPPSLETFKVVSSNEFTPLAKLKLELPRPEVLQSVRFDGDRAFAITFERTDPLFTFDLSDPANPKQVGELEIPGWVYHMEPRGERLYGIGFDNDVEGAALHVSLFDVSDLENPTMLDRVNFGGDWANFSEDQDRIHKSFKLFDEAGMMVVPFSGWSQESESNCWGSYQSGVQLVDYTEDKLTLRGVAPQVGEARRAFIHKDHLFGTGDDTVQTFDISDRDAPKKIDTLDVARNVTTVRVVGDRVLRFGNDWWTERALLDIVPEDQAGDATAGTSIDLSELIEDDRDVCGTDDAWQYSYWGNVYTNGNHAYLERFIESGTNGASQSQLKFFVLDITEGQAPAVVGQFSTKIDNGNRDSGYERLTGTLQTDSALLVGRTMYEAQNDGDQKRKYSYDIFDIRDSAEPKFIENFVVPETIASRGWGQPVASCGLDYGWGWGGSEQGSLVSGDMIASTHSEALNGNDARARMYLDRLDVSDPENPTMLEKVNVPGEAIHYDHKRGTLVTLEYDVQVKELSQDECWQQNIPNQYFSDKECRSFERHLNVLEVSDDQATRIARTKLDGTGDDSGWHMTNLSVTNERVFVNQYREAANNKDGESLRSNRTQVFMTETLKSLGDIAGTPGWYWGNLRARGSRAFVSQYGGELLVYDASDSGSKPTVSSHPLSGWGCDSLEVRDDHAYCAEGKKGVSVFSLK